MASDRGQNRYSDFLALETLLRFENYSSSHCQLSSWRRFHVVFESSHPLFHRTVFFGAPLASLRGVAMGLCRRCVIFMSSCRRVFLSSTALQGRYLMYGDIHCIDFTCISYTFPFLLGTPCYSVTLLPCYSVILLPCYLVTLSPYCSVPLLLCPFVTLLPSSLVPLLLCCHFFNFSLFLLDKSQFFFPYRRVLFSRVRSWLNGLHYKSVFVQSNY